MNSWDCFDTLIARKLFYPYTIFDEVGRILNIDNFTRLRIDAEKNSDGTFLGIYKNLPNVDPDVELNVELQHCYPIVNNINKVNDGDIIVSDMYLDEKFIKKMLLKCGLKKDVKIIVTPNGKRSGSVWKGLPKVGFHIGDNIKSDYEIPKKLGINSIHYTDSNFSEIENLVYKEDTNLACWMRFLRLQCSFNTEHETRLWNDQANYNIPVLVLSTLELPEKNIIFNYRDCIYWKPLYEKITGKTAKVLHSSRRCYNNPSEDFRKYVISETQDSLIVDIHGSGKSVINFFGYLPDILYISSSQKYSISGFKSHAIEKHNCSSLGTLIGWENNMPIRDICENEETVVKVQSNINHLACETVSNFKISKNKELLKIILIKMENNYTQQVVYHKDTH